MNTNNSTARHLMNKPIAKLMPKSQAKAIWDDLMAEGWIKGEGWSLIRPEECEGAFYFVKVNQAKTNVFYAGMEVVS